jgi:hypothetical protein
LKVKFTPIGKMGLGGVMAIETRGDAVTVSVAEPETPPCGIVARIVVIPGASPCASPLLGAVLDTDATPVSLDTQLTVVVTSWCEPSLMVAVAM